MARLNGNENGPARYPPARSGATDCRVKPGDDAENSDDVQLYGDVVAGRVRIRADLVGFLDQLLRRRLVQAGQRDVELGGQAEAAFRARADADGRGDRGFSRDVLLVL